MQDGDTDRRRNRGHESHSVSRGLPRHGRRSRGLVVPTTGAFSCLPAGTRAEEARMDLILKALPERLTNMKVHVISMSLSTDEGVVGQAVVSDPVAEVSAKAARCRHCARHLRRESSQWRKPAKQPVRPSHTPASCLLRLPWDPSPTRSSRSSTRRHDAAGQAYHYAAVHPINSTEPFDVYMMEADDTSQHCTNVGYSDAVDHIRANGDLSKTILAYQIRPFMHSSRAQTAALTPSQRTSWDCMSRARSMPGTASTRQACHIDSIMAIPRHRC